MNHSITAGLALLLVGVMSAVQADHHELKQTARGWVEAASESPTALATYIDKHMADDGVFVPPRYVGFGFSFDPRNDDDMVVLQVTPGTPAAAVLKAGDRFISVAGTPATYENRDRLLFRGKPGETVKAVIERNGQSLDIAVARGVIATESPKAQSLRDLATADPDDWKVDTLKISEVVQEGNVVFVVSDIEDTEADTGLPYRERSVQRFEFNDDGQVIRTWALGESRFVLEQLGYSINR